MNLQVGILIVLILCSSTFGQSTPTCNNGQAVTYRDVLLKSILGVITRYFSENSVGENGFSLIDESETYTVTQLFERRYGEGASTAEFLSGFLEILNAPVVMNGLASSENLDNVIGLIFLGEFDGARMETNQLIISSLQSDFGELNRDDLTEHQQSLLTDAVQSSLASIEQAVSGTRFEVFLNLKVGSTLSFALDVTGSMGGEIAATKERIISIIETTRGTIQQPLQYVLSPFNDPGIGPLTVTPDPDIIIEALNLLSASGGGDEPELALAGIEAALLASTRRSVVFMITDATAKDFGLTNRVIALSIIRKIRIISLLTKDLASPNGYPLYDRISSASGGLVTVTDKGSINDITELFITLTAQGQVKLLLSTDSTEPIVPFYVDPTITDVSIVVSTEEAINPIQGVFDGSGNLVDMNITVNTTGLMILRLPNDASAGEYKLEFTGGVAYSLEIAGDSTFGALPTIFEREDDGNYVSKAQFRSGREAYIDVTVFGNENNYQVSLTNVVLVSQYGVNIDFVPLYKCGSESDNEYKSEVFVIPSSRFFIKLVGVDEFGNKFVRVDSYAITPLKSEIFLSNVDNQVVDVGKTVTVRTELTNKESTNLFVIDISDPLGFVSGFTPTSATLGQDQTVEILIELTIPVDAQDDTLSVVTVIGTPQSDEENEFVFTTFNVAARNPDVIKCPALRSLTGSKIKCSDRNFVGSECTVTCDPNYVVEGPRSVTCLDGGLWSHSILSCKLVGSEQCRMVGDPHYTTFDGMMYDFQGTCVYTAVETIFNETTDGLEPFSILVENQHLGRSTRVSYLKKATLNVYNTTFVLYPGNIFTVNGELKQAPYTIGAQGLKVFLSGSNLVVRTRFGLRMFYNGRFNLLVRLSASYSGYVKGLCGNFDGSKENDNSVNGTMLSEYDYGNRFKVPDSPEGCSDGSILDGISNCPGMDEYARLCNIINEDCFEACREHIPTTGILEECEFDMCATQGDVSSLEQAIQAYALRCQLMGYIICNWRNKIDSPLQCGAHSHYELEGTSCFNTCNSPTSSTRCSEPPQEGCICDEGYVLSGEECVLLSECGCVLNGQYFKDKATFYQGDCTELCECANGEITCESTSCGNGRVCGISQESQMLDCIAAKTATCSASGDPHYTSFDGRRFDFQGSCTYLFVGINSDNGYGLSVKVENEVRNGNTRVTWVKSVSIEFQYEFNNQIKNVTVNLGKLGDNILPGAQIEGFFPTTKVIKFMKEEGFAVSLSGKKISVSIGEVVIAYQQNQIQVSIPGYFANEVTGLCGNFNDDGSDDFMMKNGTVTSDVNLFGDSFLVGECSAPVTPKPFECPDADRELYSGNLYCGRIIASSSIFANCNETLNLQNLFENCVFDMCAYNGATIVLETALEEVVDFCQRNGAGAGLCDWRAMANVSNTIQCPENSRYTGCASGCPSSCTNLYAQDRCDLQVDGCECNFGYVWDQDKCVQRRDCGCYAPGERFLNRGQRWSNDDGSISCSCNGPNKLECIETTCEDVTATCSASGDPHYTSFDGKRFDFQGSCTYLFVGINSDNGYGLSVKVENEVRNGNTRVTWVKSVSIEFQYEFNNQIKNVTVNLGKLGDNPLEGAEVIGWFSEARVLDELYAGTFEIKRSGLNVLVKVGRTVITYRPNVISVTLPKCYASKVTGLCGNFNDDDSDDFMMKNGTVTSDINLFGDSFLVGECSAPVTPKPFECSDADRELYVEKCGVILSSTNVSSTSFFSNCNSEVDLIASYQDCLFDLCATNGDSGVFEASIESVVRICQEKGFGFELCNWRNEFGIPFPYECPENSYYNGCTSACPNTCKDPSAEASCDKANIEGCECVRGYVLEGRKCVRVEECGCYPDGELPVPVGYEATYKNCTETCRCDRPNKWRCERTSCEEGLICESVESTFQCVPPLQSCVLWGASYVSTFDGNQFNFNGNCSYTLARFAGNAITPSFAVIGQKSFLRANGLPGYTVYAHIQSNDVSYPETHVVIGSDGTTVLVNGIQLLPGSATKYYQVLTQGTYTVVSFSFGLILRSSTQYSGIMVTVPGSLENKVDGICGLFDSDPENDIKHGPNGKVTFDSVEFGNLWQYKGAEIKEASCSIGTPINEKCENYRHYNFLKSSQSCGALALATSAVSACHDVINPEVFVMACVASACQYNQYLEIIEQSLAGYHALCTLVGVLPGSLRDPPVPALQCPPNSTYTENLPSCIRTCADPEARRCSSTLGLAVFQNTEGCLCDDGYLWSVDKCVPENRCGCIAPAEGFYFENGQCSWNRSCSEKCLCRNGVWNCEVSRCYDNDQYCGTKEGKYGCHFTNACLYDNGGCSHSCAFENGVATCKCPFGMVLWDDKTCKKFDGDVCKAHEDSCAFTLAEWTEDFDKWRYHYYEKYLPIFQAYVAGQDMSHIGAIIPQQCNVNWTRWFDSDDPAGCGDEETVERIRRMYPDELCKTPIAVDARIVGGETCESGSANITIRESSGKIGFLCNNIDQADGIDCPDYEVRFLCAKEDDMDKPKEGISMCEP